MFNEIDNLEGLNLLKEEEQTELKDLFSNFKATYNPSNRFDVQFALKTSLKRSLVYKTDLMESTSAMEKKKQKHFEGDTKDKIKIVIATNTIQENSQDESSVDIRNGINSVIEKKLPASPIKADIMNYELKISKSNNTKCLNCKKPKSTIAKVR
jgi:hypothetical protein